MTLTDSISPSRQTPTHDIYDLGDRWLYVATDQITISGVKLPDLIPNKGRAVTQLAVYWYELLQSIIGTNFISAELDQLPDELAKQAEQLAGRSLILAKVEDIPLQARVYGYLTHDVEPEYLAAGTVGGVEAEPGLVLNSHLDQCIYIPWRTDESGEIVEQTDLMGTIGMYGTRDGMVLCSNSLELYEIVHGLARAADVIWAEMRIAFGWVEEQVVLTSVPLPDNSLLWADGDYQAGAELADLVRQPAQDWLAANWDKAGYPPALPAQLVEGLSRRYIELCESITNEEFIAG